LVQIDPIYHIDAIGPFGTKPSFSRKTFLFLEISQSKGPISSYFGKDA